MNTEKKDFSCPICNESRNTTLFEDTIGDYPIVFGYDSSPAQKKSFRIVKCSNCGHAYASPRHSNIYQNYNDVIDYNYLKTSDVRKKTAEKVLKEIIKYKKTGTLLDFGCSTGEFLEVAERSFKCDGVELSEWALNKCKEKNLTVTNSIKDETYDVITMFGVIEHLEHPFDVIDELYTHLNPGGIIVVWTGNIDNIVSKAMGKNWYYIQGQHIQYFTKQSLTSIMKSAGLKLVHIGVYPYVMNLKYISKSLERYTSLAVVSKVLRLKYIRNIEITLKVPCEMFAIFIK